MFCVVVFGVCFVVFGVCLWLCVCGCLFFCVFVVVFLWCLCCWVVVCGLVGWCGVGFGGCVSCVEVGGSWVCECGFLSEFAVRVWVTG